MVVPSLFFWDTRGRGRTCQAVPPIGSLGKSYTFDQHVLTYHGVALYAISHPCTTHDARLPRTTCYRPQMIKDNESRIGDGPWTVVLWRDRQPAILSGLDRFPVGGDRFEVDGVC